MANLKNEFNFLLEFEGGVGIAHWVLVRHYSKVINEEYWNDFTKEAVGGPKYLYNDSLIRAYSTPASFGMALAADGVTRVAPGDIPTDSRIYYVHSAVSIERGDVIYELNWDKKEEPEEIVYTLEEEDIPNGIVAMKEKSEVLKVLNYSSDTGGVDEYKKVLAEHHIL